MERQPRAVVLNLDCTRNHLERKKKKNPAAQMNYIRMSRAKTQASSNFCFFKDSPGDSKCSQS